MDYKHMDTDKNTDKKTDSFKFCKLIADIESGKVEPKKRKKKMCEIFIIIKKKNSKK
jgi:hypothetical protein